MDMLQILPIVKEVAMYIVVPLAVALFKSERLALNNTTQANGIVHWYKLAKAALAVIPPEDIKALHERLEHLGDEQDGPALEQ